jgi:copper chaperone NosL
MAREKTRLLLAGAGLLLGLSLWLPLWATRLEAPQYRGDEALRVQIYSTAVAGDVKEIETLNQYIGVRLPLDAPELRAVPWVLGLLCAVALTAALAPLGMQRKLAGVLFGLMLATTLSAAALAQYRLYALGHHRGHTPLARVHDFTPPLLGSIQIENFHVHTSIGLGGWAFLAALALTAAVVLSRRPRRPTAASGVSAAEPPAQMHPAKG